MKTSTVAVAGSATLLALFQSCPAPVAIVGVIVEAVYGGIIGGGLSGITYGVASGHIKRSIGAGSPHFIDIDHVKREDIFESLPQPAGSICKFQLEAASNGSPILFSPAGPQGFRMDNVPSACMTLSTVLFELDGNPDGPRPTPMGAASLEYQGVTDDQLNSLQNALSKLQNAG